VVADSIGLAAQAKIGIKDFGGAIATMTLSGLSGSEAGISLNRVIQSLIQPTGDLSDAWSKLSDQTLTQALASDGLYAVMQKLRVASGGNVEVLLRWFDEIRAARGAMALMSNDGLTYTRVMEGMKDSTGATTKALATQMDTASMQIKLMINQLKAIGI